MSHPLKVEIPDDLWEKFKLHLTHHGEVSHIIRKAIKAHIHEREKVERDRDREDGGGRDGASQRGWAKET